MTKDFILGMFDKVDTRNWEELKERFCDDIVYERPGYDPIVGIDDFLTFYRDVRIIASGKHHLDHIVVDDEAGASWGHFVGKGRDGADLEVRFADVYTFEGGKIKTRISYFFRPAV